MKTRSTSLGRTNNPPTDYDGNYALRNARIEKGYSGEELGEKVGVSLHSICHYERLRHLPSKKVQRRIAKVLEKEVSELFPRDLKEYVRETIEQRGQSRRVRIKVNFVPLTKKHEGLLSYVEDFDKKISYKEFQRGIQKLLSTLSIRTREFIKLSYGFYGREYTYEEIGLKYNVTGSCVGQKIRWAIEKLGKHSEAKDLIDFFEEDRVNGGEK